MTHAKAYATIEHIDGRTERLPVVITDEDCADLTDHPFKDEFEGAVTDAALKFIHGRPEYRAVRDVYCASSGSEIELLPEPTTTEQLQRYQCQNCGFTDESDAFPDAQDAHQRFEAGDPYTDRECPHCGALAYPINPDTHPSLSEHCHDCLVEGRTTPATTVMPDPNGRWTSYCDQHAHHAQLLQPDYHGPTFHRQP